MKYIRYFFFLSFSLSLLIYSCSKEPTQTFQEEISSLLLNSEWELHPFHCDSLDIVDGEVITFIFGRQGEDGFNECFLSPPMRRFLYSVDPVDDNFNQTFINTYLILNGNEISYEVIEFDENKMLLYRSDNQNYCLYELIRTK